MGGFYFRLEPIVERINPFYNNMVKGLPGRIYDKASDAIVLPIDPVSVVGLVFPGSVVKVYINGLDQTPGVDITTVDGTFSIPVQINGGTNAISVQFFPPPLSDETTFVFEPSSFLGFEKFHPALFSLVGGQANMVLTDGSNVFFGINKIDTSTGATLRSTDDLVGNIGFTAINSIALFAQITVDSVDVLKGFARYVQADLTRTHNRTFVDPSSIIIDSTGRLFGIADLALREMNPVNLNDITTLAWPYSQAFLATDATNLYIMEQEDDNGTPSAFLMDRVHINTVTLSSVPKTLGSSVSASFTFQRDVQNERTFVNDSLYVDGLTVYFLQAAGSALTAQPLRPSRIIKATLSSGGTVITATDVIPLPFLIETPGLPGRVNRMSVGSDGLLYIGGDDEIARFNPSTNEVLHFSGGLGSVARNGAVVATKDATSIRFADASIFTDRGSVYAKVPDAPTCTAEANVFGSEVSLNVYWVDPYFSAYYIVEAQVNGGGYVQKYVNFCGEAYSQKVGLNSGDTWDWRVKGKNVFGESAYSDIASITVPSIAPAYATPSALSAVMHGDLTSVDLSWTDNELTYTHSIAIWRSLDNIDFTQVGSVYSDLFGGSNHTTTFKDMDVQYGQTAYYKVQAVKHPFGGIAHIASGFSNTFTISIPAIVTPTTPETNLMAVFQKMSWNGTPDDHTGFRIYRSLDGVNFSQIGTAGAADLFFHDTEVLSGGTDVYYKIRTVNYIAIGPDSNITKSNTTVIPNASGLIQVDTGVPGPTISYENVVNLGTKIYMGDSQRIYIYDTATSTGTNNAINSVAGFIGAGATDGVSLFYYGYGSGGGSNFDVRKIDPSTITQLAAADVSGLVGGLGVDALYDGSNIYGLRDLQSSGCFLIKTDPSTLTSTTVNIDINRSGKGQIASCGTKMLVLIPQTATVKKVDKASMAIDETFSISSPVTDFSALQVNVIGIASDGVSLFAGHYIMDTTLIDKIYISKIDPTTHAIQSYCRVPCTVANGGASVVRGLHYNAGKIYFTAKDPSGTTVAFQFVCDTDLKFMKYARGADSLSQIISDGTNVFTGELAKRLVDIIPVSNFAITLP